MASEISNLAGQLIVLNAKIQELVAQYFIYGFNSAGSNPIVQGDLIGSNAFLTPTAITNIVSNFQTVNSTLTATILNNLRLGVSTPTQAGA
jgi:hypothetical protein